MSDTPNDIVESTSVTPETSEAEQFAAKQTFAGILGEVVWLMQQSPLHRQLLIAELEWLVLQPVIGNQFRIYRKDNRPVGVLFWARVNDEVHARMKEGNIRLRPKEWQSGEHHWIVDVLAPFGNAEYFIEDAGKTLFEGKTYHYIKTNDDKVNVVTVEQS